VCLGIPGRLVELSGAGEPGHGHLAKADVSGVTRTINVGLLEDLELRPGDWVLIHVGFAMSKIDEAEAERAMGSLQLMGRAFGDELEAFVGSGIEPGGAH